MKILIWVESNGGVSGKATVHFKYAGRGYLSFGAFYSLMNKTALEVDMMFFF